jgi:hypothetical protein
MYREINFHTLRVLNTGFMITNCFVMSSRFYTRTFQHKTIGNTQEYFLIFRKKVTSSRPILCFRISPAVELCVLVAWHPAGGGSSVGHVI